MPQTRQTASPNVFRSHARCSRVSMRGGAESTTSLEGLRELSPPGTESKSIGTCSPKLAADPVFVSPPAHFRTREGPNNPSGFLPSVPGNYSRASTRGLTGIGSGFWQTHPLLTEAEPL